MKLNVLIDCNYFLSIREILQIKDGEDRILGISGGD